jgi:HK97 family phage major capsid protein
MNPIKELKERRGVKIKDADAIIAKAINEKRDLTTQENEQVRALHAEADNLLESASNMQRQFDLAAQAQPIGLSDEEVRSYSIARAIERRASAAKGEGRFDGLEAEASAAIAKRRGQSPEGFFIPVEVTHGTGDQRDEKRNLVAGTTTAGGFTVATEVMPLIELLRNKAVVAQLGATVLSGLTSNVSFPRQTAAASAAWLAETATRTATNATFGQLLLSPKRIAVKSGYSLQLLRQSSLAVEGFVRNDQTAVLGIAMDLAAIQGTGSDGQPLGIVNASGIGTITFGAAPTYAKYIEMIAAMLTANSLAGQPAFLGSPSSWTKGKTIARATNQGFIIGADNTVDGYRWASSNHLPSNRLILGDFSQVLMAYFGEPDVVVDPFTQAADGIVNVTTNHFVDVGVRQGASFVVSTDSAAQ